VRRDLVDAANVTTVLACEPAAVAGMQRVASDGALGVYQNPGAWPRAVWTCNAIAVSADDAVARLRATPLRYEPQKNARRTGTTGSGHELLVGTRACPDTPIVNVLVQDRPDGRVTVRYDAPTPGVLLFSEAFYSERRAYVDGRAVPTRRANVAFTAIEVPAGPHRVDLRYVPVSFYSGLGVSAITLIAWARVGKRA
jgi:hypothetical protein